LHPDRDDENVLTVLVLGLAAHYGASIKRFRWTDDARRAGRDSANWAAIVRRCRERGIGIEFGGKLYDAATDHILLSLLGSMAQEDDVTRRKSLGGGRLEHLLAGGAGMAEQQMPYGYAHQRHSDGRRVRTEHGFVPIADASMLEEVRTAWTHARRRRGLRGHRPLPRRPRGAPTRHGRTPRINVRRPADPPGRNRKQREVLVRERRPQPPHPNASCTWARSP